MTDTRFFEEVIKPGRWFSRRRFVCELEVADSAAFAMIFATTTIKLKDWYEHKRRGAVEFEVRLTSNRRVLDKALLAMETLRNSEEGYRFVKKLHLSLSYCDRQSGAVEHYVIGARPGTDRHAPIDPEKN